MDERQLHYRPEIDGLRAIAVIPVILFHAGFELFSGGFIGVDVFFVISGYLITSIILNEMEAGTFRLVHFYERRARRILPALFFVMLACIPFAWMWLMPRDMQDFAQSVGAVSTFSSNFHFWGESGYFDTAAELKPLLHTWSLAVEEQYYVIFPLLLLLIWSRGRRWVLAILAVLFMMSLGLAQWSADDGSDGAFYLLTTRGWELLIGAFAAFYLQKRGQALSTGILPQLAGIAGLLLIVFAIFSYDEQIPFPGFYALAPTFGTALLILFSIRGTLIHALLTRKLLVGTGLISYSMYLWHQPMFAFAKYRALAVPSESVMFALCLSVFPLAYFSWRFVEKPFRKKSLFNRRSVFKFSTSAIILFIGFYLSGQLSKGFPARMPPEVAEIASYTDDKNPRQGLCASSSKRYLPPSESCILGNKQHIIGALIGDSHSDVIAFSLHSELGKRGMGLRHMWHSGCPLIRGLQLKNKNNSFCIQYTNDAFDIVISDPSIAYVILLTRFVRYYEGTTYDNGEGGVERGGLVYVDIKRRKGVTVSNEVRKQDIFAMYAQKIENLRRKGKKVILVYPIPEQGWDVPTLAAKRLLLGKSPDVSVSLSSFKKRSHAVTALLDSLGKRENLFRVRPSSLFCDTFIKGRCAGAFASKPFYRDGDHLSNYGGSFLAKEILRYLPSRP
uniref:Peptidoglycan/LPS O-acetylase OafA/YrhL, contains acyltransferase and SGNH-hydrolase domains n=1 Tax=Candidatus Kentrum sp. DK TaxID=2126562 RepID=A0A450T156_9GAMM|nr:MAG: Peptidoglycan/LPS O-acetylase OafA/YrhL, contains acyltransferase and SGNH-hydrolase domains [Candidatus Kentron sp. DK]